MGRWLKGWHFICTLYIYILHTYIWQYEYFVWLHIHMCLISAHGIEHGGIIIPATMNTTSIYILVFEHNLLWEKWQFP